MSENLNTNKVHIVVLTWNNKTILKRCLESLENINHKNNMYDYTNFTVNVIDNNSSDGSQKIVENYSKTASRFNMLSKIIEAVDVGALEGMKRQTFFIELGGWDHHNAVVVPQSNLFYEINEAIQLFWQNIVNFFIFII